MTVNPRPRTVNEMAFYIDGVEKTIDEKLESLVERLSGLEKSMETLKHLLISSLLAPILVGVIVAVAMKWTGHA